MQRINWLNKAKGGETLYKKFEALLKERNVTAYRVSKDTGINKSTLSSWKSGKYTPKIDKLKKIANYFGVPITYFIEQ